MTSLTSQFIRGERCRKFPKKEKKLAPTIRHVRTKVEFYTYARLQMLNCFPETIPRRCPAQHTRFPLPRNATPSPAHSIHPTWPGPAFSFGFYIEPQLHTLPSSLFARSMEGEVMLRGRKRKEECGDEGGSTPKIAVVSEREAEEGEELEKMQVEEDVVAAVMKWLEEEISGSPLPPSVGGESGFYYQAPSFVTINGNEESCGPSFSDAASTVMASVDTRGLAGFSYFAAVPPEPPELQAATGVGPWCYGCAALSVDTRPAVVEEEDAWLARLLRGPAFDLDDSFL